MNLLRTWALGACLATAGLAACMQSYDDFDFNGQPGVGGSASGQSTATGSASGGGGTGAQGGAGATGGSGAQGGSGGTGSVVDCDQQYTHAQIHELCSETATECELRADTRSGDRCHDICQSGGGECLGVWNDEPSGQCGRGDSGDCANSEFSSGICLCSHGCGSGPPCPAPQTCSGGNCS